MVINLLLFLQAKGWIEWADHYLHQSSESWLPRAHCVAENPLVMGLHILSEILIGVAYFSIPIILLYIIRNKAEFFRDYKSLILLFASFIFLCGTAHFMGIVMFYYPMYWVDGIIKFITGMVSVFTAFTLYKLSPAILVLPSQDELLDAHERAERLEKRCKHLERRLEGFTDSVTAHIEELKKERTALLEELKRKNARK